jgi:hypothetical protein
VVGGAKGGLGELFLGQTGTGPQFAQFAGKQLVIIFDGATGNAGRRGRFGLVVRHRSNRVRFLFSLKFGAKIYFFRGARDSQKQRRLPAA